MKDFFIQQTNTLPIFNGDVCNIYTDSIEEIQKFFENNQALDHIENTFGISAQLNRKGKLTYVIAIIKDSSKGDNNLGQVVHEVVHTVQYICSHIGYTPLEVGDELITHLSQYLFDEYVKFMNENNIKF